MTSLKAYNNVIRYIAQRETVHYGIDNPEQQEAYYSMLRRLREEFPYGVTMGYTRS